jgi:hypothetical protein
MKKKRVEITVETERTLIVRQSGGGERGWCAECAAFTLVAPPEAAAAAGVSVREVCRRVEAGRLHFAETPDGLLLVCLNSARSAQ